MGDFAHCWESSGKNARSMSQKPYQPEKKCSDSAESKTRFPSIGAWEIPWEKKVDLATLRAKEKSLQVMTAIFEDPRHRRAQLSLDPDSVRLLISRLNVSATEATRLHEDTMLIGAWYYLPKRRAHLRLDHAGELKALDRAANQASRFLREVQPDANAIEDLLGSLSDDDPEVYREIDVQRLIADATSFIKAANRILELSKPGRGGRKPDDRRNLAIALVADAVEEASGQQVTISRNSSDGEWRFTNDAGRFLRDLMGLLGWKDERVLVGAFDKLRRKTIA
jgi:hypothetical protein